MVIERIRAKLSDIFFVKSYLCSNIHKKKPTYQTRDLWGQKSIFFIKKIILA